MGSNKKMSIHAASNGWSVRDGSGVYVCKTMGEVWDRVKDFILSTTPAAK